MIFTLKEFHMSRSKTLALMSSLAMIGAFAACGGSHEPDPAVEPMAVEPIEEPAPEPAAASASTELQGREGSGISGRITFTASTDGVTYTAEVSGLSGAGSHGFHIHETGDCSAADFTSAGGHFNPTGAIHGGPNDSEHHAGDLGNIESGADGAGTLSGSSAMLSVDDGANSVVGRAVILHEGQDDLTSQPTGDAGGRLACGVIQAGV
jgi:Cu-Zn family superoxide dismutase